MEKWFVCSDIHDDEIALKAFADFATAQNANRLAVLGDLTLRPYDKDDLEKLVKTVRPNFLNALMNIKSGNELQAVKNFLNTRLDYRVAIKDFLEAKDKDYHDTLNTEKAILENTKIPYNIIPGNYDSKLENIFTQDLHKKTTNHGNLKITGYGGACEFPPHIYLLLILGEVMEKEQIVEFTHQELYELLEKEKPDIAMIHTPPHLLCDDMYNGQNVGTPATTQYILNNSPKLILSGHIHEAGPNGNNPNGCKGIRDFVHPETGKKTIIINPGNLGRFELVNPMTLEPIKKFDYGTFAEIHIEEDGTPKKLIQYTLQTDNRAIGQVQKLYEHTI